MRDLVAIVTGGSSGIGREVAITLAKLGARVLITARRQPGIDEVCAQSENIRGIIADVAKAADVQRTIDEAIGLWGRLDVLINNAGAGGIMPLAEATEERINDIFAVNVVGPSLLTAAAVPHLSGKGGAIINISSTYGHKAAAGFSHYAASKAALEHLTRCWALELAAHGVRVNAIAAGPTESGALTGMMGLTAEEAENVKEYERNLIPLKRRGTPHDVAQWIAMFANPEAAWTTGQILSVDGGLSVV
ncbi:MULTISPECIES: SDR family oxidoreductase [unclassified Sinorhizobium]|uniref:SDR family NAD(P)-dependent oxidoreductase n=1 Tax=unclassified Sinorhizobium TaxID=2613772 RepID=UPI0024C3BDB6|nr:MULTISPECIES: SDR family oxidoreductase [unclassified Sinorhizobium]MDK1373759.1 SDR family oxidoreductase [Sinorhizobium sp. 6-70]MDK1478740.1 SDR family oxidoreductase [Sinorhizobium sp. 6-117]